MSFDNTSTTSQSNMGSSAQGTGIPSAANNPYTTNFSPNMNMNAVAGGQNSADASQISTPRFPISKKSKLPWKIIFGVLLLVMLIGGGGAGYYLTQMNQDVRQQASVGTYGAGAPCNPALNQCSTGFVCRSESGQPGGERCLTPIVNPTPSLKVGCTSDSDITPAQGCAGYM